MIFGKEKLEIWLGCILVAILLTSCATRNPEWERWRDSLVPAREVAASTVEKGQPISDVKSTLACPSNYHFINCPTCNGNGGWTYTSQGACIQWKPGPVMECAMYGPDITEWVSCSRCETKGKICEPDGAVKPPKWLD